MGRGTHPVRGAAWGERGSEIMMRKKSFLERPCPWGYAGSRETRLRCGKNLFDEEWVNSVILIGSRDKTEQIGDLEISDRKTRDRT